MFGFIQLIYDLRVFAEYTQRVIASNVINISESCCTVTMFL